MSYLIEDNSFSRDSYGVRATRLYFLSNRIDTYAVELSISGDMLTWAQGVVAEFDEAQDKQSAELGEKNEAFQTSQEADMALQERYQLLKELVQARYGDDDDKLQIYGITGPSPRARDEVIDKAEAIIEGNDRQTAASDPLALPQTMIDNLQILVNDAKDKYHLAGIERSEAEQATIEINNLYDADSKKLRSIYSWVVAFWGKYDPRLIELGFVPATPRTGGGTLPESPVLEYAPNEFYWDEVTGATSYQLVYKSTSETEWIELYSGPFPMGSIAFDPGEGEWVARVRARNANGYGDWSNEKTVFFGLLPPQNVNLIFLGLPDNHLRLSWEPVIGADTNDIYKSAVALGQPAGTFTFAGTIPTSPYEEVASLGMRTYYYIIAKNAEYTSEPSVTVFFDVPVT